MRKPFYRTSQKCWYFKNEAGKFIRLDRDEEKAMQIWHSIIYPRSAPDPNVTIKSICNAFIDEHEHILKKDRMKRICLISSQFCLHFGVNAIWNKATPGLFFGWVNEPKKFHVKKDGSHAMKNWSVAKKRDAGVIMKKIFRWAYEQGLIPKNPLASLRMPYPKPRSQLVDDNVHSKLVLESKKTKLGRAFATYLIASKCGARPIQIREVTTGHVMYMKDGSVYWLFEDHKTEAKTNRKLSIYLSPCLQTLTRILVANRQNGLLFRNGNGSEWKKDTVCQTVRRLRTRLDLPDTIIPYSYRHSFATNSLLAGVDVATTAALLGHSSIAMVSKVYGHLDQHNEHLSKAAAKATEKRFLAEE